VAADGFAQTNAAARYHSDDRTSCSASRCVIKVYAATQHRRDAFAGANVVAAMIAQSLNGPRRQGFPQHIWPAFRINQNPMDRLGKPGVRQY
jgi:hypothetical protein